MFSFKFRDKYAEESFAQSGEDLIIARIFGRLGILSPSYFDIGTNDPIKSNNTYYFYKNGSRGLCIEADPEIFATIKNIRHKDICLNVGVGTGSETQADFYIMSASVLNTFCKETALRYSSYASHKIKKIISIPLLSINRVAGDYFVPDLISLDVEGLDFKILTSINFDMLRPKVFCIETLSYTEDKSEKKMTSIIGFMLNQGYFIYADTYINTIFVEKNLWRNR